MGGFLKFSDLSHPSWSSGEVIGTLTDSAKLFIFVFSPLYGGLIAWSKNAKEVLGIADYEIARGGNLFLRCVHTDDRFIFQNKLESCFENKVSLSAVYRWVRPDTRELCWLLCRAQPVERDNELVYEGVIADISAEVNHVGGNASNFAPIFDQLEELVVVLNPESHILYINQPRTLQTFKFGDPHFNIDNFKIGREFLECFSDTTKRNELDEILTRVREQNGATSGHISKTLKFTDNSSVFQIEVFDVTGQNGELNKLLIVKDITKITKLEEDSASLKRASNFVQLAAGISHNVNNTLQTIIGHAAAIRSNRSDDSFVDLSCGEIIKLVEQTACLTHQLLSFRDSMSDDTSSVDLNLVIMSALERVKDLLSSGVKIAVSFGTIPATNGNLQTLVSAFESIIRHAHTVFPNSKALTISTTNISDTNKQGANAAKKFIKVTIGESSGSTKTRKDLSQALLRELRNPTHGSAFTEAVAIINKYGANINFEAMPNGGAAFTLHFLVNEEIKISHPIASNPTGSPQILIIDDDPLVLSTVAGILRESGYRCLTAENRRDAVNCYRKNNRDIDLVILDALMPEGHGSALLKLMKKINPEIKVLGFSGASQPETKPLLDAGAIEVLRKPVNPNKLIETVKDILGEQKAA